MTFFPDRDDNDASFHNRDKRYTITVSPHDVSRERKSVLRDCNFPMLFTNSRN